MPTPIIAGDPQATFDRLYHQGVEQRKQINELQARSDRYQKLRYRSPENTKKTDVNRVMTTEQRSTVDRLFGDATVTQQRKEENIRKAEHEAKKQVVVPRIDANRVDWQRLFKPSLERSNRPIQRQPPSVKNILSVSPEADVTDHTSALHCFWALHARLGGDAGGYQESLSSDAKDIFEDVMIHAKLLTPTEMGRLAWDREDRQLSCFMALFGSQSSVSVAPTLAEVVSALGIHRPTSGTSSAPFRFVEVRHVACERLSLVLSLSPHASWELCDCGARDSLLSLVTSSSLWGSLKALGEHREFPTLFRLSIGMCRALIEQSPSVAEWLVERHPAVGRVMIEALTLLSNSFALTTTWVILRTAVTNGGASLQEAAMAVGILGRSTQIVVGAACDGMMQFLSLHGTQLMALIQESTLSGPSKIPFELAPVVARRRIRHLREELARLQGLLVASQQQLLAAVEGSPEQQRLAVEQVKFRLAVKRCDRQLIIACSPYSDIGANIDIPDDCEPVVSLAHGPDEGNGAEGDSLLREQVASPEPQPNDPVALSGDDQPKGAAVKGASLVPVKRRNLLSHHGDGVDYQIALNCFWAIHTTLQRVDSQRKGALPAALQHYLQAMVVRFVLLEAAELSQLPWDHSDPSVWCHMALRAPKEPMDCPCAVSLGDVWVALGMGRANTCGKNIPNVGPRGVSDKRLSFLIKSTAHESWAACESGSRKSLLAFVVSSRHWLSLGALCDHTEFSSLFDLHFGLCRAILYQSMEAAERVVSRVPSSLLPMASSYLVFGSSTVPQISFLISRVSQAPDLHAPLRELWCSQGCPAAHPLAQALRWEPMVPEVATDGNVQVPLTRWLLRNPTDGSSQYIAKMSGVQVVDVLVRCCVSGRQAGGAERLVRELVNRLLDLNAYQQVAEVLLVFGDAGSLESVKSHAGACSAVCQLVGVMGDMGASSPSSSRTTDERSRKSAVLVELGADAVVVERLGSGTKNCSGVAPPLTATQAARLVPEAAAVKSLGPMLEKFNNGSMALLKYLLVNALKEYSTRREVVETIMGCLVQLKMFDTIAEAIIMTGAPRDYAPVLSNADVEASLKEQLAFIAECRSEYLASDERTSGRKATLTLKELSLYEPEQPVVTKYISQTNLARPLLEIIRHTTPEEDAAEALQHRLCQGDEISEKFVKHYLLLAMQAKRHIISKVLATHLNCSSTDLSRTSIVHATIMFGDASEYKLVVSMSECKSELDQTLRALWDDKISPISWSSTDSDQQAIAQLISSEFGLPSNEMVRQTPFSCSYSQISPELADGPEEDVSLFYRGAFKRVASRSVVSILKNEPDDEIGILMSFIENRPMQYLLQADAGAQELLLADVIRGHHLERMKTFAERAQWTLRHGMIPVATLLKTPATIVLGELPECDASRFQRASFKIPNDRVLNIIKEEDNDDLALMFSFVDSRPLQYLRQLTDRSQQREVLEFLQGHPLTRLQQFGTLWSKIWKHSPPLEGPPESDAQRQRRICRTIDELPKDFVFWVHATDPSTLLQLLLQLDTRHLQEVLWRHYPSVVWNISLPLDLMLAFGACGIPEATTLKRLLRFANEAMAISLRAKDQVGNEFVVDMMQQAIRSEVAEWNARRNLNHLRDLGDVIQVIEIPSEAVSLVWEPRTSGIETAVPDRDTTVSEIVVQVQDAAEPAPCTTTTVVNFCFTPQRNLFLEMMGLQSDELEALRRESQSLSSHTSDCQQRVAQAWGWSSFTATALYQSACLAAQDTKQRIATDSESLQLDLVFSPPPLEAYIWHMRCKKGIRTPMEDRLLRGYLQKLTQRELHHHVLRDAQEHSRISQFVAWNDVRNRNGAIPLEMTWNPTRKVQRILEIGDQVGWSSLAITRSPQGQLVQVSQCTTQSSIRLSRAIVQTLGVPIQMSTWSLELAEEVRLQAREDKKKSAYHGFIYHISDFLTNPVGYRPVVRIDDESLAEQFYFSTTARERSAAFLHFMDKPKYFFKPIRSRYFSIRPWLRNRLREPDLWTHDQFLAPVIWDLLASLRVPLGAILLTVFAALSYFRASSGVDEAEEISPGMQAFYAPEKYLLQLIMSERRRLQLVKILSSRSKIFARRTFQEYWHAYSQVDEPETRKRFLLELLSTPALHPFLLPIVPDDTEAIAMRQMLDSPKADFSFDSWSETLLANRFGGSYICKLANEDVKGLIDVVVNLSASIAACINEKIAFVDVLRACPGIIPADVLPIFAQGVIIAAFEDCEQPRERLSLLVFSALIPTMLPFLVAPTKGASDIERANQLRRALSDASVLSFGLSFVDSFTAEKLPEVKNAGQMLLDEFTAKRFDKLRSLLRRDVTTRFLATIAQMADTMSPSSAAEVFSPKRPLAGVLAMAERCKVLSSDFSFLAVERLDHFNHTIAKSFFIPKPNLPSSPSNDEKPIAEVEDAIAATAAFSMSRFVKVELLVVLQLSSLCDTITSDIRWVSKRAYAQKGSVLLGSIAAASKNASYLLKAVTLHGGDANFVLSDASQWVLFSQFRELSVGLKRKSKQAATPSPDFAREVRDYIIVMQRLLTARNSLPLFFLLLSVTSRSGCQWDTSIALQRVKELELGEPEVVHKKLFDNSVFVADVFDKGIE